jgi:ATP-binding cassette subfamily D (ALD) long-chain fatty acid import protein
MKSAGRTDTELLSILHAVHLAYLPDREGGWETRKEWKDVLSGGEKQRVRIRSATGHPLENLTDLVASFRSALRGCFITGPSLLYWMVGRGYLCICVGLLTHFENWTRSECTSAVSSDVEGSLYTQAKDMGMTLFTIS